MKKVLFFIIAVIILSVSMMPCADGASIIKGEFGKYSLAKSTTENEPHNDACSPFCICACCAASAFYHPVTYSKTIPLVFKSLKYLSNDDFNSYDFHSVWQPPKLG